MTEIIVYNKNRKECYSRQTEDKSLGDVDSRALELCSTGGGQYGQKLQSYISFLSKLGLELARSKGDC